MLRQGKSNALLGTREIDRHCGTDREGDQLLRHARDEILLGQKFLSNQVGALLRKISAQFLTDLLNKRAPDFKDGEYHFPKGEDGPRVSRQDYLKKLLALCVEAKINCDAERTRVSTPAGNPTIK